MVTKFELASKHQNQYRCTAKKSTSALKKNEKRQQAMARKLKTPGYVYITARIVSATKDEVMVDDGANTEWLPRSQIEDPEIIKVGDKIELLITESIAKEKGLI